MSQDTLFPCRLCLKDSHFCYSLFDEEVTEIIESFTSIKIDEEDNLPTTCCSKCLEDVYLVYKIRNRIIESDQILRQKKILSYAELEEITLPVKVEIADKPPDEILEPLEIKKSEDVDESGDENDAEEICDSADYNNDLEPEAEVIKITINPDINEVYRRQIALKQKSVVPSYKCTECQQTFPLRSIYHQHMKKHKLTSVCKICGLQVLQNNYKRHMEVHEGTPKICELCGTVAKNTESLRGHMFYMHKSTAEQYKCEHCDKFFRYRYKYHLHMRKQHGGDKSHMCDVCGKGFYTFRDVKRHIQMTHMKLRPHICQYCNKGFSSAYARSTHVRQHTNEKPFKCDVCAEGFRQRVSLKTHLKSKHGIVVVGAQGWDKVIVEKQGE